MYYVHNTSNIAYNTDVDAHLQAASIGNARAFVHLFFFFRCFYYQNIAFITSKICEIIRFQTKLKMLIIININSTIILNAAANIYLSLMCRSMVMFDE